MNTKRHTTEPYGKRGPQPLPRAWRALRGLRLRKELRQERVLIRVAQVHAGLVHCVHLFPFDKLKNIFLQWTTNPAQFLQINQYAFFDIPEIQLQISPKQNCKNRERGRGQRGVHTKRIRITNMRFRLGEDKRCAAMQVAVAAAEAARARAVL